MFPVPTIIGARHHASCAVVASGHGLQSRNAVDSQRVVLRYSASLRVRALMAGEGAVVTVLMSRALCQYLGSQRVCGCGPWTST
jgi:hypothetical protein